MDENKLTDLNTVPQEKPKENVDNASTENPFAPKPDQFSLFAPKPYQFSLDDLKAIRLNIKKQEEYEAKEQARVQAKIKEFNFGLSSAVEKFYDIVYPKTVVKTKESKTPDETKQFDASSVKPVKPKETVERRPVPLWKVDEQYKQDALNAAKGIESYIISQVGEEGLQEFFKYNPEIKNAIVELRNSLSDKNWEALRAGQDHAAWQKTVSGLIRQVPILGEIFASSKQQRELAKGKTLLEQAKIFSPTVNFLNTFAAGTVKFQLDMANGLAKLITLAQMGSDTDEETLKKFGDLLKQYEEGVNSINATFNIKENPFKKPSEEYLKEGKYLEYIKDFFSRVPEGTANQAPQVVSMLYGGYLTSKFSSFLKYLGPIATIFPIHVSEVFNQTIEENRKQTSPQSNSLVVTKSLLAASVNTAVDLLSFEFLFGKLLRKTNPSFKDMSSLELQKVANQGLSKAAIEQILKFGATEIPAEVFQEMSKRWASRLPLFDANAIRVYNQIAYEVSTSFPLSLLGVGTNIQNKNAANSELIYRQLTDTSRFSFEAQAEINNAPSAAFNYIIPLGPTITPIDTVTTEETITPEVTVTPEVTITPESTVIPEETVQQQVQTTEQPTPQTINQIDLLSEARTWIQQRMEKDSKVSSTYSQNEIASLVNNLTPIKVANFIQSEYVNGAEGFVNQVMSNKKFNKTNYDFSKDKYWNSQINTINYSDIISGKLPKYKDYLNKAFSNKNVIKSQQTPIEAKLQPPFTLEESTFLGSKLPKEVIEKRLKENDEHLTTGRDGSKARDAFDYLNKYIDKPSFKAIFEQIKSGKTILISNMDDLPSWYSRDYDAYGPNSYIALGFNDRIHNNSLVILADNVWNDVVANNPNLNNEEITTLFNKTIFETLLHENLHSSLVVYSPEEYEVIMQKAKNSLINYDKVSDAFNSQLHDNFIRSLTLYNAKNYTTDTTSYISQLNFVHNNIISFLNNTHGTRESLDSPREIIKYGLDNLREYSRLIGKIRRILKNIDKTENKELINDFNSLVDSEFFENTIENLINGQSNLTTREFLRTAFYIIDSTQNQGFMEEVLAYTIERVDLQLIDEKILDYKDYIRRLGKKIEITKSDIKSVLSTSIRASKRFSGKTFVAGKRRKLGFNELLINSFPTPSKIESIDDFIKLVSLNIMNTKLSPVEPKIFSLRKFKIQITGNLDTIYTLDEDEIRKLNSDVDRASKLYISLYNRKLKEEEEDFLDKYSESQNKFYSALAEAEIVPGVWVQNDSNNDVSRYVGAKVKQGVITLSFLSKQNKYKVMDDGIIIYDTPTAIELQFISNYTVLDTEQASWYSSAKNNKELQKITNSGIGKKQFEVSESEVRSLFDKYFPDQSKTPNTHFISMWVSKFIKSVRFTMSKGGNENITNQVWMKHQTPKFVRTVINEVLTERKEELFDKRKKMLLSALKKREENAEALADERYKTSFKSKLEPYSDKIIKELKNKIKLTDNKKSFNDITNEQFRIWLKEYSFSEDDINSFINEIEKWKINNKEAAELNDLEFEQAKIDILTKVMAKHYAPIIQLEMGLYEDWVSNEEEQIRKKIESEKEEIQNKQMPSSWVMYDDITAKIGKVSKDSIHRLKDSLEEEYDELALEIDKLPKENRTEDQDLEYKFLIDKALENVELQRHYNQLIANEGDMGTEIESTSQWVFDNTYEKISSIGYAFTQLLDSIKKKSEAIKKAKQYNESKKLVKGAKGYNPLADEEEGKIFLSMPDELLINDELQKLESKKETLKNLLLNNPENQDNQTQLNEVTLHIYQLESLREDLAKKRKEHADYLIEIDLLLNSELPPMDRVQLQKERDISANFDNWHRDNIISRYLNFSASLGYLKLLSLKERDAHNKASARIVTEIGSGEKNVITPDVLNSSVLPSVSYEQVAVQKFSPVKMLEDTIKKSIIKKSYSFEKLAKSNGLDIQVLANEVNTIADGLQHILPKVYIKFEDAVNVAIKIVENKYKQKINPTVNKFLVIDTALSDMRQRLDWDTGFKKIFGKNQISFVYTEDREINAALKLRKMDAVTIAFWDAIKEFTSPDVDKFIEITTEKVIIDENGNERKEIKKVLKQVSNKEYREFIEKSDKDSRNRYVLRTPDGRRIEAKNAFSLALFAKNERKNDAASKVGIRLFAGINKSTKKIIESLDKKITTTQEEISKIKTNIEKRKRGEGIIRNGVKTVNFDTTKLERDLSEKLSILEKLESDKKYQEEAEFNLKWDYYLSPEEKRTLSFIYASNLAKYGIDFDYDKDYERLIEDIAIPSIQSKVNKFYNYMYGYLNGLERKDFEDAFLLSHTNEMMTTIFNAAESGDYSRIMYKKGRPQAPTESSDTNVIQVGSSGIADTNFVNRRFAKFVANSIGTGIITGLGVYSYTNDKRILAGLSFEEELINQTAFIGATLGGLYIINNEFRQKEYFKAVALAFSQIEDPKEKAKFLGRVLLDRRFGFSEVEKYELFRFQDKWSSLTQQITMSANALEKELASASMHGNINLGIDYTKAVMYARLVNQYLDPTDEIINNSLLTGPDKELSLLPMAQQIYNNNEFETARAALKSFIEEKLKTLRETSSENPEEQNRIKNETERINTIYDVWFGFSEEAQARALVKWENTLSRLMSNPSYITGFPSEKIIKGLPKELDLTEIALILRKEKVKELQEQAYNRLPDSAKPHAKDIKFRIEFISNQLLEISRAGFELGTTPTSKDDKITKLSKEIEIERKLGEYLPTVYEAFDSHASWLLQPDLDQRQEEFKREFLKHFYEVTIKKQKTKIIKQEMGRKNYKTGEIVPEWGEKRVKKFLSKNDTKANNEKINEFLKSLTPDEAKVVNELLSAIDNLTMHEKDNAERKKQTPAEAKAETRFANRKKALRLDVLLQLANRNQISLNQFTKIVNQIRGAEYIKRAKEMAHNQYIPSAINKAIFEDKNIKLLDSYQKFLGKLENPWERAAVGSAKNIMFLSSVTFQKHLRKVLIQSGFASEQQTGGFTETFTEHENISSLALSKANQFGFLNNLYYTPYGKFLTLAWIENDVERNWYTKSIGFIKFQQVILNSATWIRQILSDGVAAITLGYMVKNPYNAVRLLYVTLKMQSAYKYGSPVAKTQKFKNQFKKLLNKELLDKFSIEDKDSDPVDAILNQIMAMGVFKENIVTEDILSNLGANQPLFTTKDKFNIRELIELFTTKKFKKEPFSKTQTQGIKESRGFTREMISRIGYFFGTTNNAGRLGVLLNFMNELSKIPTFTPDNIVNISYQKTHSVVPRWETYPETIKLASRYGILNPFIFFEIMGTRAIFNQLRTIGELQRPQGVSKLIGRDVTENESKQLKKISSKLLMSLIVGLGINYLLLHTRMFSGDEDKDELSEKEKKNIDKLVSGYQAGRTWNYKLNTKKMEISIFNNEYATYFSPLIWGTEYGIIGLSEIVKEINQDGSWDYEKSKLDGGVAILEKGFRQKFAESPISPVIPFVSAIAFGRNPKTGQILDDIKDEGRETTVLGRIPAATELALESLTPPDFKRLKKIEEEKTNYRNWLELATIGRNTTTFKYRDFWNASIYKESQAYKNQISELNKRAFEIEPGESLDYSIEKLTPSYINYRNAIIRKALALRDSGMVGDERLFARIITGDYGIKTPLINDSELQVYSIFGIDRVMEVLKEIPDTGIGQRKTETSLRDWSLKNIAGEIPPDKQVDIVANQFGKRLKELFNDGLIASPKEQNGITYNDYLWEDFNIKAKQKIVDHFNEAFPWLYSYQRMNEEKDIDDMYTYNSVKVGSREERFHPDKMSLDNLKKDLINNPNTTDDYLHLETDEEKIQSIFRIKYEIDKYIKEGNLFKGKLMVNEKGEFYFTGTEEEKRSMEKVLQFHLLKTFSTGPKDKTKERMGFKNFSNMNEVDFGFFDREKQTKSQQKNIIYLSLDGGPAKTIDTRTLIQRILGLKTLQIYQQQIINRGGK